MTGTHGILRHEGEGVENETVMCPRCWYKNVNGSRHEHDATSDTDHLPPSEPSNHGIGPQSFPPMTAVGTVGRASCAIAAYFAILIFSIIREEASGCACSISSGKITLVASCDT